MGEVIGIDTGRRAAAPVRVIVVDHDALLSFDGHLGEANRGALRLAQWAHIRVLLASCRPTAALAQHARALDLADNGGFLLSHDGAVVHDCESGEEIHRCGLHAREIDLVLALALGHEAHVHAYVEERIVTQRLNRFTEGEGQLTGLPIEQVRSLRHAIRSPLVKLVLMEVPDRLNAIEQAARVALGDAVELRRVRPCFLEVTHPDCNRRRGIEAVCRRLGIHRSGVLAIGHRRNDFTLVDGGSAAAAIGVPTREKDRARARYVVASDDEDGVAEAVFRHALAR